MCADLGTRTIREEVDALRVMGIDPIRALLVPRVLAATIVALLLSSLVTLTGIPEAASSRCSSKTRDARRFVAAMTFITGLIDVLVHGVGHVVRTDRGPGRLRPGHGSRRWTCRRRKRGERDGGVFVVLPFIISIVVTAIGFEITT